MGTKMGPSYANLFVGYIEHKFFNPYNGPKPELYRRYIADCIGATSSSREELNQFIIAVIRFTLLLNIPGKFPILLQHFWISKFLSKATVYALVCTTNPQILIVIYCIHLHIHHMSILYSQFLRLRRLCSDDSNFSLKSEEMCNFFNKRGYPASVVRQSALQTSQRDNNDRIPFTLTFHPHNHAVKSIILKKL